MSTGIGSQVSSAVFKLALMVASLGVVLWAPLTHAAAFVVTATDDTADGTCDAHCSLREAITAANANASPPHTITFNIAPAGPVTISILTTALPSITRDTDISAATEAISDAPGVRIDGSALASGDGLDFANTADGSSVAFL